MTTWEIILLALWAFLALGVALNWRAQVSWHRHYMELLRRRDVKPAPVIRVKP